MPIADLLPAVIERCAGPGVAAGPGGWELAPRGEPPLPRDRTLADCGIVAHDRLHLQSESGSAAAGTAATPRQAAAGSPESPVGRARALLPPNLRWSQRLGEALSAAVQGGAVDDDPPLDGAAAAAVRLTHEPRRTRLEQARRAWRDGDYRHRLERSITEPRLQRCATVAVLSPKGGVGKTALTTLLGTLLAMLRRDRVVAVDSNPDYGSLGRMLTPAHRVFVDDLLEMLGRPGLTVTRLDAALGRAIHGLMVLPAPTDPARMARLDQEAYTGLVRRLQDLVGVVIMDCGTGVHERAARAAQATCDQIVLVSDAEPATASLVTEAFQLLEGPGTPIVLVVNRMPARGSRLDLDKLAAHLPRASAMVVVPAEPEAGARLAAGRFSWDDAPPGWQLAIRELAAVLTAQWPDLGLTV